ncbi:hypothetical protein GQ53DRAFT_361370 [Thozetella sp. PMI_491]|nr:hypothetical protein GQ53DRAFT_361370 [Thozetella sp. PMI_491]
MVPHLSENPTASSMARKQLASELGTAKLPRHIAPNQSMALAARNAQSSAELTAVWAQSCNVPCLLFSGRPAFAGQDPAMCRSLGFSSRESKIFCDGSKGANEQPRIQGFRQCLANWGANYKRGLPPHIRPTLRPPGFGQPAYLDVPCLS